LSATLKSSMSSLSEHITDKACHVAILKFVFISTSCMASNFWHNVTFISIIKTSAMYQQLCQDIDYCINMINMK
jgi:hypothetical protein